MFHGFLETFPFWMFESFIGFSQLLEKHVMIMFVSMPQHLVDKTFGLEQFFSPPTHTMGGPRMARMPHRSLMWLVKPLLVVVAKPWANKEKDKKALGLEIGNSHVDRRHFRLYAFFWYIIYMYTVAIASR